MGKPPAVIQRDLLVEHIDLEKGTWGTETSKYPEEKKAFP
jgi:hypothetical protein